MDRGETVGLHDNEAVEEEAVVESLKDPSEETGMISGNITVVWPLLLLGLSLCSSSSLLKELSCVSSLLQRAFLEVLSVGSNALM